MDKKPTHINKTKGVHILILSAIVWIVIAYLVADYARKQKKRDFLFWFLLALLTSPLIAFIILLIAGRK